MCWPSRCSRPPSWSSSRSSSPRSATSRIWCTGTSSGTALTRSTWRDIGTQITGVVLVLVGLLLLILGLRRGRPDTLELAGSTSGATVTITRRSLQQALNNAAASTEGVEKARVAVRRRKVKVKVSSPMLQAAPVRQAVEASTGRLLDGLGLARPLRVNTKVKLRSIGPGA